MQNVIMTAHQLEGPRAARLEERERLIEMINFVFRIQQGRAPTIGRDWAHVYAPENLANVMVMCDPQREAAAQPESASVAGQVVASTGVWVRDVMLGAHTLRVGGINCVGTLPEYRRLGLGSQVMEDAHQTMRAQGCHVGLLSTGITNWYRRLGWESAGVIRRYALNRGNIGLLPPLRSGLQTRMVAMDLGADALVMDAGVAGAVVRLYGEARWGAVRTEETLQQLVYARSVERLMLAEDGGQVVAYLLLHDHTVMEWAGAAADVLGLVRAAFAMLDDPKLSTSQRQAVPRGEDGRKPSLRSLTLQTPGPDTGGLHRLLTWLDGRGIPFHSDYLGMLYVVDPPGVLAAFGLEDVHLVTQQGVDGGERFVVTVEDRSLTLDRGQLAKLFFGPERVLDGAHSPFPLPIWQWPLEMV